MPNSASQLDVVATESGWSLDGEVDAHTAPRLASALSDIAPETSVQLDFSGVSFVDSSGLRVLLEASQRAESMGSRLVIRAPQASMRRLVEIGGLVDYLHLAE